MQQAYKVLAPLPAEDMFSLFLAPAGGSDHSEGQHWAPHQPNTSHVASLGRGGGISYAYRRGKAFGPKSPAQAAPGIGDLGTSPQCWGFPSTLQNTALTGVTAIRDRDRAGGVQGCSSMGRASPCPCWPCSSELEAGRAQQPSQTLPGGHGHLC